MTGDEYREFLTFLFEHYVRPRLSHVRRRFHPNMSRLAWSYHLDLIVSVKSCEVSHGNPLCASRLRRSRSSSSAASRARATGVQVSQFD